MTDRKLIRLIKTTWCRKGMPALTEREVLKVTGRWWVIGYQDDQPVAYSATVEPWGRTRLRISFAPAKADILTLEGLI